MLRRWLHKLVSIFRHRQLDSELDEEIRAHLEMAIEENVSRGMTPGEARLAARRSFGGVDQMKERHREVRGFQWIGDLGQDMRLALRALLRDRGFTAAAVLTLAVGIGANTAIFSVVYGVLLRPLPYPDADRIVRVEAGVLRPQAGAADMPFSDAGYWHFVNNNRAFEAFGGYEGDGPPLFLTGDGPPVQISIASMTASAFEVLGTLPQRGRLPTAEEDVRGGPRLLLISHRLWVNRYGSDPSIIGRNIELQGIPWEVIGVMPDGYDFPRLGVDIWRTYRLDPESETLQPRSSAIARLAPGVTIEAAIADAERLIAGFGEIGYGPDWSEQFSGEAFVRPLKDEIIGGSREPLLILLGTVAFVLLIACSNVANLLLVRAESRTRERAVRIALGSGRGRLIRYIMMESMLLSLAGGAAGVALAYVGTRILVSVGPASIPRIGDIGINGHVLLFTTGISVAAGLLFGLLPALRAGSERALAVLRDGGRGSTIGRERHRARSALVVAQVALALVLLVGAGLMVRTFRELRSVDLGFDPAGLMTFRVVPPCCYSSPEGPALLYEQLRERLEAIPGVTSAAAITLLPITGGDRILLLGGEGFLPTQIEDFPTSEGDAPTFLMRRATPGYFGTMGIPIIEGREFIPDDHRERLSSLLISESIKRQYWPNESALGKRLTVAGAPARVVGVVGDVHNVGLDVPAEQFVYKPILDSEGFGAVYEMTFAVRAGGDPNLLVPSIRAAVEGLNPQIPITNLQSMDDILADSISRTSFVMTLLVVAAVIALFLGSVGIYGVLSYVATLRTAEMGVRLALGANPGMVRKIILSQGMVLAVWGVVLGLAGAIALGGVLSSLLFGVSPLDPPTLVGVSVLFLAVTAVSSLIPAMRAARTSPAVALRAE